MTRYPPSWKPSSLRIILVLAGVSAIAMGLLSWTRTDFYNPFLPRVVFAGLAFGLAIASWLDRRVEARAQDGTYALGLGLMAWFSYVTYRHQLMLDDVVGFLPIATVVPTLARSWLEVALVVLLGAGTFGLVGLLVETEFSAGISVLLLLLISLGIGMPTLTQQALRAELRSTNARLEDLVSQRTRQLEQSLSVLRDEVATRRRAEEQALAASHAKSAFLMTMSHELRTPLNAILGYVELVVEELEDDGVGAQSIEDLAKVESAANHLLSLIDQLLDLTRIEAGALEVQRERVDVVAIVHSVVSDSAQGFEHGNALVVDAPAEIVASLDARIIRQILTNLVGNAQKFTESGTITVRVRLADGLLELCVTDTGIGMDPDAVGRIFEHFTQLDDSPTRLHGGAGLGLAITRQLVEHLGGEIEVGTAPGEGSTFRVLLPVTA